MEASKLIQAIPNIPDIPGIDISSFPLSEVKLTAKITLSYSDAKDLIKKTSAGLPANEELREWFFDKIGVAFEGVLVEKGKL